MKIQTISVIMQNIIANTMFFIILFATTSWAQPSTIPILKIVQPFYNDSPAMQIEWTPIENAEDYEIRRKDDEEEYYEWVSIKLLTGGELDNGIVDNNLSMDVLYTYQVRAIIQGIPQKASPPRSNKIAKIWPVTNSSSISCNGEESLEVLTGYNQYIYHPSRDDSCDPDDRRLHEGIDLQGPEDIDGECVKSPFGGIVKKRYCSTDDNCYINISVHINGEERCFQFNHLWLNQNLKEENSVSVGDILGFITKTTWSTPANHAHVSFWNDGNCSTADIDNKFRNPFEMWDDILRYSDPQENAPEVSDSNSDGKAVRFRKGTDGASYFSEHEVTVKGIQKVYGSVDIVVEAFDKQSIDAPWVSPKKIGYYIIQKRKTNHIDVVQSREQPYMLIDNKNWFGFPFDQFPHEKSELLKTMFDDNDNLAGGEPAVPFWYFSSEKLKTWLTYIVTNTIGTEGRPEDLDADQCWATDVQKDDNQSPNGYRAGYHAALRSQDAKFPDGNYHIGTRLEDYVHTYPDVQDHLEPVVVDNFSPYIEQVTLTSVADSATMYDAAWLPGADTPQGLQLLFALNTANPIPAAGTSVHLVLKASEPMRDVSFRFGGQPTSLVLNATDDSQMIWDGDLTIPEPSSPQEELQLIITGHDTADNPLLDFADSSPKILPKRTDSGAWVCPVAEIAAAASYAPNSTDPASKSDPPPPAQTCAVPSDAGDTAHRLTTISVSGWTMTLPESGTCEESGGGVVCAFGTPKPDGSTAHYGRMALLPKEADPQAVTLMPFASSETTHHGLHVLPDGLRLEVQPNAEWFGDCAEETAEARCPDSLDCQGDDANNPQCRPPDPQEQPETKSLPYQIAVAEDSANDACRVTVTYTIPDGGKQEAELEIQPARLCQTLTDRNGETGVQEAQAICGWEKVNMIGPPYVFHEAGTSQSSLDTRLHTDMALCNEWDWKHAWFSSSMTGFECQQNPEWKQCPAPRTTPVIPPGQPGWSEKQVIRTDVACHGEWEEFVHIFKSGECCFFSSYVHLDGNVLPRKSASILATITQTIQEYEIVAQCEYQRMTQHIGSWVKSVDFYT